MALFRRAPDPGPPGICPGCWDSKYIMPHCMDTPCAVWRCGNCRRLFTKHPARSVERGLLPPLELPAAGTRWDPPMTEHPKPELDALKTPIPPKETP